jgi:hypothetical protein
MIFRKPYMLKLIYKNSNLLNNSSYKDTSLIGPFTRPNDHSVQSTSYLTEDENKEKTKVFKFNFVF